MKKAHPSKRILSFLLCLTMIASIPHATVAFAAASSDFPMVTDITADKAM